MLKNVKSIAKKGFNLALAGYMSLTSPFISNLETELMKSRLYQISNSREKIDEALMIRDIANLVTSLDSELKIILDDNKLNYYKNSLSKKIAKSFEGYKLPTSINENLNNNIDLYFDKNIKTIFNQYYQEQNIGLINYFEDAIRCINKSLPLPEVPENLAKTKYRDFFLNNIYNLPDLDGSKYYILDNNEGFLGNKSNQKGLEMIDARSKFIKALYLNKNYNNKITFLNESVNFLKSFSVNNRETKAEKKQKKTTAIVQAEQLARLAYDSLLSNVNKDNFFIANRGMNLFGRALEYVKEELKEYDIKSILPDIHYFKFTSKKKIMNGIKVLEPDIDNFSLKDKAFDIYKKTFEQYCKENCVNFSMEESLIFDDWDDTGDTTLDTIDMLQTFNKNISKENFRYLFNSPKALYIAKSPEELKGLLDGKQPLQKTLKDWRKIFGPEGKQLEIGIDYNIDWVNFGLKKEDMLTQKGIHNSKYVIKPNGDKIKSNELLFPTDITKGPNGVKIEEEFSKTELDSLGTFEIYSFLKDKYDILDPIALLPDEFRKSEYGISSRNKIFETLDRYVINEDTNEVSSIDIIFKTNKLNKIITTFYKNIGDNISNDEVESIVDDLIYNYDTAKESLVNTVNDITKCLDIYNKSKDISKLNSDLGNIVINSFDNRIRMGVDNLFRKKDASNLYQDILDEFYINSANDSNYHNDEFIAA